MKMIGMSVRSTATRFCRSRPLRSGRPTSSTRQLGARACGRARNARADANVSGCQPAQRISNSSDSRTEISSSTTNTIGVGGAMCDYLDSGYSECGIERPEQGRLAELFVQALRGPPREHERADRLIPGRGNEYDRNLLPATRQFLLQIVSGHPWHRA